MEQRESSEQYHRPSSMPPFRASQEPRSEKRALQESKLNSSKSETECKEASENSHQPSHRPAFRAPQEPFTAKDFVYGEILGLGSYSKVVKAKKKDTGVTYALKIMDKLHIVKENKTSYVKLERIILDQLEHPGVVRLFFTFQDAHYLYMGLECCDGGELFDQIQRKKQLSLDEARFYASELVEVMEYLHGQGLIHRDLKPENLLLTRDGHLKVVDFGSAKVLRPVSNGLIQNLPDDKCCTFVGTAEYVSPEVLNSYPVTIGVDLWALGCIIYQMLVGRPPFKCASEYLTFQKVMARDFKLPDHLPPEAKDLINSLLDLDPDKRPGAGPDGYTTLKAHPFFHGIEWTQLRTLPAPPVVSVPATESIEDGWRIDDDDALDPEWDLAHIGGGTTTKDMTGKASDLKSSTEMSSDVISRNVPAPFGENVIQKMVKLNMNEPHLTLNQTGYQKGQLPSDLVELERETISPANSLGVESLISVTGGDVPMDSGPECLNRPMNLKI